MEGGFWKIFTALPPELIYAVITAILAGIGSIWINSSKKGKQDHNHPIDPPYRQPPYLTPDLFENVCNYDEIEIKRLRSQLLTVEEEIAKLKRKVGDLKNSEDDN